MCVVKKLLQIAFFILFFINNAYSQDIKKLLSKAFTSKDSSDYFFKKAKQNIKTPADEAEYYFCKNARCNDYGILDSTIVYGSIAIEKLKKLNNYNSMGYVYNNMGKTYNRLGKYDKAIEVLIDGLKIAESTQNEYWIFHFTISISLNYHDFESFEKGAFYGLKAVKLAETAKKDGNSKLRLAQNTLAINYDDWNKPEKALFYHYKNIKLYKGKDTLLLATSYNNIGNTLLKQKKFSESQKWLNRSLKLSEINFKNKPRDQIYFYSFSTIYTNLAAIAYQLDDFEKAEKLFEKAEYFAKNSKNAEKQRDYYQHFYLFNKKRNNLEKTIYSQEKYLVLRDSVFKTERAATFAELETKYQTEKKEKELLQSKTQIIQKDLETKQKNNQFIIASILALGFLIIGYLVYRQQKQKNQQQAQENDLKLAIEKIESQNKLQEQRLSISRDLHDNIGSQLTFIISSVDNVKYGFDITNEKLDNKLTNISSFAKETILELRDTIWAMNSNEIAFEDLEIRINNFIEKAKLSKENISFSFAIDENLKTKKLSSVEGMNIYRTIQEAINNAIKYAEADIISVIIKQQVNQTAITIKDNGKGFDPETTEKGNGLKNMQKRIEEIGGKFSLKSSIDGTKIEILI
jgi:signal transduction histidine kinase